MSELQEIEILVRPTYGEIYWSAVFVNKRLYRTLLYICGAMLVLIVALLLYVWTHPRLGADWANLSSSSKLFLLVLAGPFLIVFAFPLLTTWTSCRTPKMVNGFRYNFADLEIQFESLVGKSHLKWDIFRDAAETTSAFYLFEDRQRINTLPKRCFANTQEVASFRKLLKAKFPNARIREG